MKNNKLKLTSFTNYKIRGNNFNNITGGSPYCGNTCDCTCSCEQGNTQQKNSNATNVSTSNRDNGFVSEVVELGIAISWLNQ